MCLCRSWRAWKVSQGHNSYFLLAYLMSENDWREHIKWYRICFVCWILPSHSILLVLPALSHATAKITKLKLKTLITTQNIYNPIVIVSLFHETTVLFPLPWKDLFEIIFTFSNIMKPLALFCQRSGWGRPSPSPLSSPWCASWVKYHHPHRHHHQVLLTRLPRIWLMAADSFNVHSACTTGRISWSSRQSCWLVLFIKEKWKFDILILTFM